MRECAIGWGRTKTFTPPDGPAPTPVRFAQFEEVAREAFDAIPESYRVGIDGLVVSRDAVPHPELPDIWTLGMCDTESYPSDWVGPDTTRSVVILYWGSFRNLARLAPDFDWEAEIHETVEHEVKHHLEWLAGHDDLGSVDYAMDESFKRAEGLDWDPWFYQHGEQVAAGVFAIEDQSFIEMELSAADFDALPEVRFRWREWDWVFPRPSRLGDVHFVRVVGVDGAPPLLEVVLVRDLGWWDRLRAAWRGRGTEVIESDAEVRRADAR